MAVTVSAVAAARYVAQANGTSYPRDRATQALLIRSARTAEERAEIIAAIMEARAVWLAWLTRTQRKWQCENTRRPSRARHHDSVAIREKYVRCAQS